MSVRQHRVAIRKYGEPHTESFEIMQTGIGLQISLNIQCVVL